MHNMTDYDQPCQINWCHKFSQYLAHDKEAEIQILHFIYVLLPCQTTKTAQKGT